MEDREIAVEVARSYIGTPYRWGGDDPIEGFDCSGLTGEALTSANRLQRGFDTTAMGLYRIFEDVWVWRRKKPTGSFDKSGLEVLAGCLVFFGESLDKISHVEMLMDEEHTIGASGGGRTTISLEAAVKANAFIKIRPLFSRKDVLAIVDPFQHPRVYTALNLL